MKDTTRRFRPEKTGVRTPLGDLEMAVMRHLWAGGTEGACATDIQEAIQLHRPVAVTTVLTTLYRLEEKEIVRRETEQRPFRFFPAVTEDELEQRIVQSVLEGLVSKFPKAVATYFAQQARQSESGGGASEPSAPLAELAKRLEALRSNPSDPDRAGGPTGPEEAG